MKFLTLTTLVCMCSFAMANTSLDCTKGSMYLSDMEDEESSVKFRKSVLKLTDEETVFASSKNATVTFSRSDDDQTFNIILKEKNSDDVEFVSYEFNSNIKMVMLNAANNKVQFSLFDCKLR